MFIRLPQFCVYILCFGFVLQLTSCIHHHELVNFNEGKDFAKEIQQVPSPPPFKVQPDDILFIQVSAPDIQTATPFNPMMLQTGQLFQQGRGPSPLEYLVDKDGDIQFPVIGDIHVAGMTTTEITDTLSHLLMPHLKNPVVKVRVLNFRVTVFGEVQRPGVVSLPEESMTLFEALGMTGDMTNFADRSKVLVVRENNGTREYHRINLNDKSLFESDCYYLHQGDVVYVEPLEQKGGILSNKWSTITDMVGRGSSFLSILLSILINTNVVGN